MTRYLSDPIDLNTRDEARLSSGQPSRPPRVRPFWLAAAGLTLLALSGCDGLTLTPGLVEDPEPDTPVQPDPEPAVEPDPSPEPDPPVDAGPGPKPDAGPLRTMHERPLLGGMPTHNRFLDPWMTQTAAGWLFLSGDPFSWPQVRRVQGPKHPMNAPALHIDKGLNPEGVEAYGTARSSSGALALSVWAAREEGTADPGMETLDAALIGVFEDEGELAVDLVFDATTPPVHADGLTWMRFEADLSEGPVGWAYLRLTDSSDADLYIAAPVMEATSSLGFSASAPRDAPRRPLTDRERAGLQAVRERMRDQLSAPEGELPDHRRPPLRSGPVRASAAR